MDKFLQGVMVTIFGIMVAGCTVADHDLSIDLNATLNNINPTYSQDVDAVKSEKRPITEPSLDDVYIDPVVENFLDNLNAKEVKILSALTFNNTYMFVRDLGFSNPEAYSVITTDSAAYLVHGISSSRYYTKSKEARTQYDLYNIYKLDGDLPALKAYTTLSKYQYDDSKEAEESARNMLKYLAGRANFSVMDAIKMGIIIKSKNKDTVPESLYNMMYPKTEAMFGDVREIDVQPESFVLYTYGPKEDLDKKVKRELYEFYERTAQEYENKLKIEGPTQSSLYVQVKQTN